MQTSLLATFIQLKNRKVITINKFVVHFVTHIWKYLLPTTTFVFVT